MATFETANALKQNIKQSISQSTIKSQQLCNQQENRQQQQSNNSSLKSLDVKTKSIESTLQPLVNQVCE